MNPERRLSLQTRIWVALAVLVVLAVAGEFVGAARRRFLRRDVSEIPAPTLLQGQVLLRVKGPDGWPVPQARVVQIGIPAQPGRTSGSRQAYGMSSGFVVLPPLAAGETVRRLEVSGAVDTADAPLPFGAILTQPVPEGSATFEVVLPVERTIPGSIRQGGTPVHGVKVRARMAYPEELSGLSETSNDIWHDIRVTGEDGRFLLQHLGAGLQEVAFRGSRESRLPTAGSKAGCPWTSTWMPVG